MADENEDQWLYGDSVDSKDVPGTEAESENQKDDGDEPMDRETRTENDENEDANPEVPPVESEEPDMAVPETPEIPTNGNDGEGDEEANGDDGKEARSQDGEAGSDSDSDDDVHVVIGDIKSTPPAYNSLNIKRGGLLTTTSSVPDKLNKQPGKFSIDEFETIGVINGMSAHEFNLDQLEDKPWRQPGADITDYFNYGFNEETWRAYCERQKRMRSESGVGLILNAGGGSNNQGGCARVPQVAIMNDNSKYSGISGPKRAGPPPGRKMAGTIDVIGSSGLASRRNLDKSPPKENVIQVMTADRREYSRKPGFPDMSVPPPGPGIPPGIPPFDMPPPGYPGEPPPFYIPEADPYYHSYEPTQDSQWGNDPTWQPTNLAIPLTETDEEKDAGPKTIPTMVPPVSIPPLMPPRERESRDRDREREREKPERMDLDRERVERERDREKSERSERDLESMGRGSIADRDRERDCSDRDKESVSRDREREKESVARDEDRDRERSRSQYRHKERHRHRSRSRSRRHKSRSRSPSRRKKKSRRSDRERSKEESE